MLKYIISGEKPSIPNDDINNIDDIVTKVKRKPEVSIKYMQQWDRELQIKCDAINETKSEAGLAMIRFGRKYNISDDDIRIQLRDELKLSERTIDDLFKQLENEEK